MIEALTRREVRETSDSISCAESLEWERGLRIPAAINAGVSAFVRAADEIGLRRPGRR